MGGLLQMRFNRLVRTLVLTAIVGTLAGGMTAASRASGGSSIASAPELPIGSTVPGGTSSKEFWRVTLAAGDQLTIDYQSVNGGCAQPFVYRPDVTDYTLNSASYVALGDTSCSQPREFTWTATGQGHWTLKVSSDHGYQL